MRLSLSSLSPDIACKIHQNYKPLWRAFSGSIQQICRPINVLPNKEGVSFPLLSLQSGSKCKLKTVFGNYCISRPTQSSNEST